MGYAHWRYLPPAIPGHGGGLVLVLAIINGNVHSRTSLACIRAVAYCKLMHAAGCERVVVLSKCQGPHFRRCPAPPGF